LLAEAPQEQRFLLTHGEPTERELTEICGREGREPDQKTEIEQLGMKFNIQQTHNIHSSQYLNYSRIYNKLNHTNQKREKN
jgi:hypothetical protein